MKLTIQFYIGALAIEQLFQLSDWRPTVFPFVILMIVFNFWGSERY